jgi:hypothetical protein
MVVLGTALSKLCNLEALAAAIPAVPASQLGLGAGIKGVRKARYPAIAASRRPAIAGS